jgi:importin-7
LKAAFQAIGTAMQDTELPVRVQAALALTEMISAHTTIKKAVEPQVEKVIQGTVVFLFIYRTANSFMIDLLKLSDETDLDLLNNSMENMVEVFQEELLPVAVALASRLVREISQLFVQ